jgi:hypothetical protein
MPLMWQLRVGQQQNKETSDKPIAQHLLANYLDSRIPNT